MVRRKDVARFETERQIRRSHSFDFFIPDCVVKPFSTSVVIPLGFWWKATDRYFDIDFVDDGGSALALHRMTYNTKLTLSIMREYARRVLHYNSTSEMSPPTAGSIAFIVSNDAPRALNELAEWSKAPNAEIAKLSQNKEFMRLLGVAACASLFVTKIRGDFSRRHIVKLQYSERQDSYFKTDRYKTEQKTGQPKRRRLPRWLPRVFGLGVYELDLANAFVRSQSYHLEAYAPPGLQFTSASLKLADEQAGPTTERLEHSLHLEEAHLAETSFATVRSKLLVTDGWLTSAIICTAIALAVLIGVWRNAASFEPSSSQNVIAAILLIPSVAMAIVWRRVHWLVERLHKWIRYAFLSVSVLLFYLAFRIAESAPSNISSLSLHLFADPSRQYEALSRFTNGDEIAFIAKLIAIYTAGVLAVLLVARFHLDRLRDIRRNLGRQS